jgi:hypothetical protein
MSGEKESTQGGIATTPARWQDGEKSRREVRLGVVMYGGVSLAVYINGVAHEFFRAVRGRGVYRLIKALTDSDIIVDVISGTSAGGINGIMLSYALCDDRDFSSAATLWRTHGDISKLLRSPKEATSATSILDSEGYYQPNLEKVFASMERYVPEPYEDNSTLSELDLFVTGTDVDGNVYTLFDDAGHPIDVKDHRSVFLLSHRKGRAGKEPFNTSAEKTVSGERSPTIQALAKLCRLTSCFPGAFAPVSVSRPESERLADDKLQKWGNLGKAATFLDGGVLNNKPFSHTLKAIFSRSADREVKRKLFYVEPDPECMKQLEDPTVPNFVQTILAALIGIPGYQSIAGDLKFLREHNSKLEQYNRLVKDLDEASAPGPRTKTLYEHCRRVFICDRVLQGVFRVQGRDALIDPRDRDRAAKLANKFDQYDTDWNALFSAFDVYYRLRRLTRVTYLIHDLLYNDNKDLPLSDRAATQYRRLWQVLNQQTALYEVLRSAMEELIDNAPIPWKTLEIDQVWSSVRNAYSNLLDDDGAPAKSIEPPKLDEIEGGSEWLPSISLTALNQALLGCCKDIAQGVQHGTLNPPGGGSKRTLLERLDEYEKSIVEHFTDPGDRVRAAYAKFMDLDTDLFPLEMVGDLHEKDIIETVRISPRDAQKGFSLAEPSDKVTGTMVYHFGAFFKRSWRSNDILWGRLDGLCQLIETLLEEKRLRQIVSNDEWRKTVRRRFFVSSNSGNADEWNQALDPANLFPKAGARSQAELRQWLENLLSEESKRRDQALDGLSTKVELLIEAAQLEVINEDLPNVIFDAVSEQAEWNNFKVVETKKDAKPKGTASATAAGAQSGDVAITDAEAVSPFIFQRASGQFDPFFATLGAVEHMRRAMLAFDEDARAPLSPKETRLGSFFIRNYTIAKERLQRDVPQPVLLELLATGLLVVRNCILNLPYMEKIKRHPLYIFGADLPLRAFYAAAILMRRAPQWILATYITVALLSMLSLAIAFFWWDSLMSGTKGVRTFFILVALPAVLLVGEALLLIFTSRLFRKRNQSQNG